MPTYMYECIHCQEPFEVRASIRDKIAGLAPQCPLCGSQDVKQKVAAVSVVRGGSRSSDTGCCGPNNGPGCCR